MATKKISGKGLAADIRSRMDCVSLTEKHDLSVAQLKKALGTHFERIQQILNNRTEMVVLWVTHWDQ